MDTRKSIGLILGLFALAHVPFASAQDPGLIQVGMANSFFNDVPKGVVEIVVHPFKEVMKETTGLDGALNPNHNAFEVGKKLNDNQFQMAVFHGHEFAWVQQQYPSLRPLMIATNKHREVKAFVLVKQESPAKKLSDLSGKKFAIAIQTKEHCRVFLDRALSDNAQVIPKNFFGSIVKSDTPEAALDDVCLGKIDGALVDTVSLELYRRIKAPCLDRMRILAQSDDFPSPVIAYKQGTLDDATLTKFRDGLARAGQTETGRDMMKLWKIEAFQGIPENYTQQLARVLKAYPSPKANGK